MNAEGTRPRISELCVLTVWIALGGPRPVRNRSVAFWRNGRGLNVQIYPDTATWKDFKTGLGGGILALVERILGCDRRGALQWLGDNFGVSTGTVRRTLKERQEFARRLQLARHAATIISGRRAESLIDLRSASGILLERYHNLIRESKAERDIDKLAKAEEVFAMLDVIAGRRDYLKSASGPELQRYFAAFESEVA